ncbi:unnamed protein product [Rhodiola kirilowii]
MTQQAAPQPVQSFYQPPHRKYNQNIPPAGQYQQRGPNQYQAGPNNHQGPNQYQAGPSHQGLSKPIKDVVKELASTVHRNMAKTDGAIADLTKHMSQLAISISALTNDPGRLPSQTIQNPRGNVNAVTLRSGKKLVIQPIEQEEDESPELPEESKDAPEEEENAPEERRPSPVPVTSPVPITETSKISASLPFPVPARSPKQHVMDKDVFELFSKVEINIPLLISWDVFELFSKAIKQIPLYAKF